MTPLAAVVTCGVVAQLQGGVVCPASGTPFTGDGAYMGRRGVAAPLRGAVGCVDFAALNRRPTAVVGGQVQAAVNIYGPMEAGFDQSRPGAACLADYVLPGGVDTNLAEAVMDRECRVRTPSSGGMGPLLDYCGGHAMPFHYHERASCLYTADPVTQHSTRVGTALDGNGIYGHNIAGGCEPVDLDWCGGRYGVTPDSNGETVYYYVIGNRAPFTLGCFGPVTSEAQCRALYPQCDGVTVEFTTEHGTGLYDLDCPCFDPVTGSNVPGMGRPGFLSAEGFERFSCVGCTSEEAAAIAAQYASVKCASGNPPSPMAAPAGSSEGPPSLRLKLNVAFLLFSEVTFLTAVKAIMGPSFGSGRVNWACPAVACEGAVCPNAACRSGATGPRRDGAALQMTTSEDVVVDFDVYDANGVELTPAQYVGAATQINADMTSCWNARFCQLRAFDPVSPAVLTTQTTPTVPTPSPDARRIGTLVPTTPVPENVTSDDDGMSGIAIFAVVLGVLLVCALVGLLAYVFMKRRKAEEKGDAPDQEDGTDTVYAGHDEPRANPIDAMTMGEYAPGEPVEALDESDGKYHRATVHSRSADGTYAVEWSDGQFTHGIPAASLRPRNSSPRKSRKSRKAPPRFSPPASPLTASPTASPPPMMPFFAGMHVSAMYIDGSWYDAVVKSADGDGLYSLVWDDGTESREVPETQLRPRD